MRSQVLIQVQTHRGATAIWLMVLFLLALAAIPTHAQNATACDFSSAHHMSIEGGDRLRSWVFVSNPAIMQAPAQWVGESFWRGYESPDPFDGFFPIRAIYVARYRDRTGNLIGIIWIASHGHGAVRALMIDPRGRADDDHACAAIEVPREVVDQWFDRAFWGHE